MQSTREITTSACMVRTGAASWVEGGAPVKGGAGGHLVSHSSAPWPSASSRRDMLFGGLRETILISVHGMDAGAGVKVQVRLLAADAARPCASIAGSTFGARSCDFPLLDGPVLSVDSLTQQSHYCRGAPHAHLWRKRPIEARKSMHNTIRYCFYIAVMAFS